MKVLSTRAYWLTVVFHDQDSLGQTGSNSTLAAAVDKDPHGRHAGAHKNGPCTAVQRLCFGSDGVAANFGSEAVTMGTFWKHLMVPWSKLII